MTKKHLEIPTPADLTRRRFLKGAAMTALMPGVFMACSDSSSDASAATSSALPSGSTTDVSSQGANSGTPRSLVCVFLAGGADSFNMFLPNELDQDGSTFDIYAKTRRDIAPPRSDILDVGNGDYAFHPGLPNLASLFDSNQLSVVANVGPLVRSTTASDFRQHLELPQSLFAHDAQQNLWHTGASHVDGANFGWGAQIASHLGGESGGLDIESGGLARGISTSGSNKWQTSATEPYLRLHPTRQLARLGGYDASIREWVPSSASLAQAMEQILSGAERSPDTLLSATGTSIRRSMETTLALETVTADQPENDVAMGDYGANELAEQLHLVARLIKAREQLGQGQQIFFVQMGGWDTHSDQNERLPPLLATLDEALGQFQYAIGPEGLDMADSVCTFTASDFGRTLTSNGNGTDHAWGGHSFVMGGGVDGGKVNGLLPNFSASNNPDDAGELDGYAGRIIPKTSVTQLGATLAAWCGVPNSELPSIFPDLANFENQNLRLFR